MRVKLRCGTLNVPELLVGAARRRSRRETGRRRAPSDALCIGDPSARLFPSPSIDPRTWARPRAGPASSSHSFYVVACCYLFWIAHRACLAQSSRDILCYCSLPILHAYK